MDYEQKYKHALDLAKQVHDTTISKQQKENIEIIFPELKESEDEKIRKALVDALNKNLGNGIEKYGTTLNAALTWLEKQGQKKYIDDLTQQEAMDAAVAKCFEQGGQKSAWSEEDEPQKELAETYLAVFDEKFPILPILNGKQLADYKNFLNKCQQILGLKYWSLRPLQAKLFEKLSLLWAAWGAEHLKGLGQTNGNTDNEKQEWSEEDEKMYRGLMAVCDVWSTASSFYPKENEDVERLKNWLKSLKTRITWKPSDEQMEALKTSFLYWKGVTKEVPCTERLESLYEQLKQF